jgi:hypothetical protein
LTPDQDDLAEPLDGDLGLGESGMSDMLSGSCVSVLAFCADMMESSFAGRWPAMRERRVGDACACRPVWSMNQS